MNAAVYRIRRAAALAALGCRAVVTLAVTRASARRSPAALLAIAATLAVSLLATASAFATTGVYWGATIGTQFTGREAPWDMSAVTAFSQRDAGGKAPSLVSWGSSFYSTASCQGYCSFQQAQYQSVASYGGIPVISWESVDSDSDSAYTDAEIAAGAQDAYITAWAEAAKAWGHPFFLRFDWEMNGSWFPWGVGYNGNTAASYVAMWQHVHNIFTSVGATNVNWVWCPNIDPADGLAPLASLYPGNQYVDWTGLDGYNANTTNWNRQWDSFATLFGSTYATITGSIAPSKPMMLGEVASTESGGSKAQWIAAMLDVLPSQFPDIHAFLWYDVNTVGTGGYSDWPIESSASAQGAFTSGIASSTYESNHYASLTSPIPVPGAATTTTSTTLPKASTAASAARTEPSVGVAAVGPAITAAQKKRAKTGRHKSRKRTRRTRRTRRASWGRVVCAQVSSTRRHPAARRHGRPAKRSSDLVCRARARARSS